MDGSRARLLPDLWVSRSDPRSSTDSRGAEIQARYISEARTLYAPVVYVSRADDDRQKLGAEAGGVLTATIRERTASGRHRIRKVRFDIETLQVEVERQRTPFPYIAAHLHVPRNNECREKDGFHSSVEGLLASPDFSRAVEEQLGYSIRTMGPDPRGQFQRMFVVQNHFVMLSPLWRLPIGPDGSEIPRHDLVFHIPLGTGPTHPSLRWVTDESNLLWPQIWAYTHQPDRGAPHTLLCFSAYTRRLAMQYGVPAEFICQFPVALPPDRLHVSPRTVDPNNPVEHLAWIGPANAPEKGLDFLVDVVEMLNFQLAPAGRKICLNAFGRVPGAGADRAFDQRSAERYQPLVATGMLRFHGFPSDAEVNAWLAANALITVNSSIPSCEGLGMASIEALLGSGCGYATRPGGGAEDAAQMMDRAFVAADANLRDEVATKAALAAAILNALDFEREQLRLHGPAWRHSLLPGAIVSFREVSAHIDGFLGGSALDLLGPDQGRGVRAFIEGAVARAQVDRVHGRGRGGFPGQDLG